MRYRRLSFAVAREREEPLTALLWELGTRGLELTSQPAGLRVDAWFDEPLPVAVRALAEGRHRPVGARLLAAVEESDADWMAAYRRQARPFRVGARLVVDPRDEAGGEAGGAGGGRRLLHLPARQAFGTGSHASTRLAVRCLERLPVTGAAVLDLGTGTGILALAALEFGARRAVALDTDPAAAFAAVDNGRRNRLPPLVAAGGLDCLATAARFDLALVNIRPERWADRLERLAGCLAAGGTVVLSGLLASEADGFASRLAAAGLEIVGRRLEGEWAALVARRRR